MTQICRNPHFISLLRNRCGVALLYLVILFTLIGVLLSLGVKKFGALVTQGKIIEAKTRLENNVRIIMSWSLNNGRLPSSAEYPGVFGSVPLDAWGRPVVFTYYSSLTNSSTGGLCGRANSTISYNGLDVAFLLLSGGDDMNISSAPNSSGFFNGALTGLQPEDLYRIVSMNELAAFAGCAGTTPGRLRIVNNELLGACKRQGYSATIYPDGGVPPYSSYVFTGLPTGLTTSAGSIFGNSSAAKGAYTVSVTVTDSTATTVKRSYILNLMSSCI